MFDAIGYLALGELPGWQGFIIDVANYLRINFYQDDMTPAAPKIGRASCRERVLS